MDIEALERRELRKKQITVGSLFILAIVLAMVFAYWMGALGFGPTRTFYLNYDFAGGIDQGSTVRLAGIKIGRVSKIEFAYNPARADPDASVDALATSTHPVGTTSLRLRLEVSNDSFRQITSDSRFYINLAGLIGERYIEIVPGTGAPVKNGQTLRGVDPPRVDQLLSQSFGIFGDLREFWRENKGDLKDIFASLNSLTQNLNRILAGLNADQRRQINVMLANFAAMSNDMRGFLASLNAASTYLEKSNAKLSFEEVQQLLHKANRIELNDIRRLMLQDGVKVNFSAKQIPPANEAAFQSQLEKSSGAAR